MRGSRSLEVQLGRGCDVEGGEVERKAVRISDYVREMDGLILQGGADPDVAALLVARAARCARCGSAGAPGGRWPG